MCKSCAPVLVTYAETFKGMKRQGSELKRRKLINPHPKSANMEHYRDLVKQNDWLQANIFILSETTSFVLNVFIMHLVSLTKDCLDRGLSREDKTVSLFDP